MLALAGISEGAQVSKPTIVTVDDDPVVSAALTRDLRERYGEGFRLVRALSGPDALDALARLALRDDPVALIVTDQRMPGMTGIEMLAQAGTHAPDAPAASATSRSRRASASTSTSYQR